MTSLPRCCLPAFGFCFGACVGGRQAGGDELRLQEPAFMSSVSSCASDSARDLGQIASSPGPALHL